MGLGLPFQGELLWWKEASYGGGRSGTTMWVSSKVYDARIDTGEICKPLRGITSPTICGYISMPSDYSFHVEWVLQNVAAAQSLATMCIKRLGTPSSRGDLQSLCFEMRANMQGTTKSQYLIKGCKCKTFNLKASMKNEYICTADFSACSVITSAVTTYLLPTAIASTVTYAQFNRPGHVLYKNTNTAIATIVDSIDITVNHNLTDYFSANNVYKQGAIPGALDVTGTAGISLDDGGKVFFDALWTGLTNIYINLNIGGYDIITLRNARWNGMAFDVNSGGDMMKVDAPFTAKDITWRIA
jgi:hypothetical protein